MYRAPNATGTNYYRKLEEEFNSLCMWATMECNTLILTGDLKLDRLRPERTEGRSMEERRVEPTKRMTGWMKETIIQ